ncbi:MAG: molybdopterin guanine dinucleotide-containing S/N-oxide reductase [Rhodobacteraceae bacterium]|nr:molybdopterin guanine dinucleotide-containing S/N-oxide reductase [Paracoccaceae bacterium]
MTQNDPLTSAHWGTYRVRVENGKVMALRGFEVDPDPSPIGNGIVDVLDGPTRIKTPMVRESWLKGGPGSATHLRGDDTFVPVSWDEVEKLVAAELDRVRETFGNQAIYGGSYGWGSAGRFHHAQSQLHRFLNCIGGYTRSVNTYSHAAGEVILPHILGDFAGLMHKQTSWQSIIDATELLVGFGGVPIRNAQISAGGTGRHRTREALIQARDAGMTFVNISPLRGDMDADLGAEWLAPRPGSDVAVMLGLAHTLLVEDLHDSVFLERYTVGFEKFSAYLMGTSDGVEKTADWADDISSLSASSIRDLARRMAKKRTMISVNWALTRQEFGEQPFWAATALAAMIGQIGLPGGGIAYGYGAANSIGLETRDVRYQALPQGNNPVADFIPVARISDMLLTPGAPFDYNGQTANYPDIKLVYWAGGNPFHHHQDLARFKRAWQKPDTVIVHEWCWNTLAKHADIVLPCTTPLERADLMLTPRDPYIVAMQQVISPVGNARNDFDIFAGISRKMGAEQAFTRGYTAEEWIRWIYDQSRKSARKTGIMLPSLKELRAKGWHKVDPPQQPRVMLEKFRNDPEANPLRTPSGKIEIYSTTIAEFGYDDCPGHPTWHEPHEWLGNPDKTHPLHLISNQPKNKLHSQLDHGAVSRAAKINGREPVLMHPDNAATRGISAGGLVRVFNDRGACLAVAVLSEDIRVDVVQISTGAWLDADWQADGTLLCRHGNPNVLTRDQGTSRLAQGPTAHSCLVDIEPYTGTPPPIRAFDPPRISDG